jgi:hypothetical protein
MTITDNYHVTIELPAGSWPLTADDLATLITPNLPSDYLITVEREARR